MLTSVSPEPQLIPVPSAPLHLQEVEPRREQHECRGLCEDPQDSAHVSVRGTLSPAPSDVIILEKEQLRPRAMQAAKGKVSPGRGLHLCPRPWTLPRPGGCGSGVLEDGEGPRRQVGPQLRVLGTVTWAAGSLSTSSASLGAAWPPGRAFCPRQGG